jgi:hypothetical protein
MCVTPCSLISTELSMEALACFSEVEEGGKMQDKVMC